MRVTLKNLDLDAARAYVDSLPFFGTLSGTVGGAGNLVLSVLDDVLSFVLSALAVLGVIAAIVAVLFVIWLRFRRRGPSAGAAGFAGPVAPSRAP